MIISKSHIESEFAWSEAKRLVTKFGKIVDLRKAPDRLSSREFYNAHRDQLGSHGVKLGPKYKAKDNSLEFTWWIEVPQSEIRAREEAAERSRSSESTLVVPMPSGLSLYPYQVAGVEYATKAFARGLGCLIADEMGLGKTAQAIGVVNAIDAIHKVLVIVPASIIGNWVREIFRFSNRRMTVGVVNGDCFPQTEWVVMSYSMAHKWRERTQGMMWDLVVLDECQKICNPAAQMTRAIVGWKPRRKNEGNIDEICSGIPTKRKLAMSGTPISNRPKEFYSVISWLDPKAWPANSYGSFAFKFCGAGDSIAKGLGWTDDGSSNMKILQTELRSTIMIRRLKADVLKELPPKTRQIFRLTLDRDQRSLIAQADRAMIQIMREHSVDMNSTDPEQLDRLSKVLESMNPRDLAASSEARKLIGKAKIGHAIGHVYEMLETVKKLIVFAHHREVLEELHQELEPFNPIMLHGGTDILDRQQLIDRFNTDPECRVAVMSVRAGGVGFNMTAASLVVMVEPDWTPGLNAQCEDRAHRIGQAENVLVHYLVADDSCDGAIISSVIRKMAVLETALNRT
jgi:SWI/SNF-related matrix-associated actin-dependent regulator 1 of chromatin subfamily A